MEYRQYGECPYIAFDNDASAGYIKLTDGTVAESREVHPAAVLDLDANGALLGIEVFSVEFIKIGERIAARLS